MCQMGFSKIFSNFVCLAQLGMLSLFRTSLNMWLYAADADGAQVLREAEHPTHGWA